MSKQEAFNRILTDYTDYFGMVCLHPSEQSDPQNGRYDAENQHLYTGIAAIMMRYYAAKIPFPDQQAFKMNVASTLQNTKIADGLYGRHPEPYVENGGHELSHDEHSGIMFYLAGTNAFGRADELCDYGSSHSWAFVEEVTGLHPWKHALRHPRDEFNRIKKQIVNYRAGKKTPNGEGSYLLRVRLPEMRGFMKEIASGFKMNTYEALNILGASILTVKKPAGSTSGKIMMFNKFKALEYAQCKSWIVKFARKRFHKKMVKMYGDNYYHDIMEIYYGVDHPFFVLSDGMTLEG